jgi:hypothetical protein
MPKSTSASNKGEQRLKEVKESQTEELAARTAVAIERYQSSSANENAEDLDFYPEDPKEESSSLSGGALWARHDFGTSDILVFTRDNGEILSIRKSPTGDGWLIIYDEPEEDLPQ